MKRDHAFRGDFDAVSDLMAQSWAKNGDQSLLYTPAFLANSFEYPGASLDMAAAVYKSGRPVAFVAGFPRTVRLRGRTLRLIVNTFLTVAPEYQGKAYGAAIWSEFVTNVRLAGYDGTINFCVDGGPTNMVVQICGPRLGYFTERIFSTTYLARMLPAPQSATTAGVLDVGLFQELAARIETSLVRLWTGPEAEWQCRGRYGAVCVTHEDGSRRGMLTGYVMDVIGGPKALLVEDLLWGSLDAAARAQLTANFLQAGAASGGTVAVAPRMGYADEQPLLQSGFRKTRRIVHTYLTLWDGPIGGPLQSHYIDVF
jgi:GNAT superfamily N-acetyltransferase